MLLGFYGPSSCALRDANLDSRGEFSNTLWVQTPQEVVLGVRFIHIPARPGLIR
jgi:hypothetical protein